MGLNRLITMFHSGSTNDFNNNNRLKSVYNSELDIYSQNSVRYKKSMLWSSLRSSNKRNKGKFFLVDEIVDDHLCAKKRNEFTGGSYHHFVVVY